MDKSTVVELTSQQVADFVENEKGILLDTLVPEHFEARHIPGAQSACVFEVVFLDHVEAAGCSKDTPIVVYGAGEGARDSETAAEKLIQAGYTDVAIFPGGLAEWRESGRSLEGTSPDEVEPPHAVLDLESKVYTLVVEESVLTWTGRNHNGGHSGTLGFVGGELDTTDAISGSFTMDMNSIRNVDLAGDELQPVLEAHLKSDDFFFTKLFPEAVFNTTKICPVTRSEATLPNFLIQGVLTLRGVSKEISFAAQIRNVDESRIALMGNLDFDRTEWGVIYGSSRFFRHLGYHVVFDLISIDFRLVLE